MHRLRLLVSGVNSSLSGIFASLPKHSIKISYGIGTNYTADLAISTIDFGTFHLYPGSCKSEFQGGNPRLLTPSKSLGGETADPVGFGSSWITSHVAVGNKLNKPGM